MKTNKNFTAFLKENYAYYLSVIYGGDKSLVYCYIKSYSTFVELESGAIIGVPKLQSLATTEWISDVGEEDYLTYARSHRAEVFRAWNMCEVEKIIKVLTAEIESKYNDICKCYLRKYTYRTTPENCPIRSLEIITRDNEYMPHEDLKAGIIEFPTKNDLRALLSVYKDLAARREKQIASYLKRYGTDNILIRTYWADR